MKLFIKQTIEMLFPKQALRYRAYNSLIRNPNSYLHKTGWIQSLEKRKPIDNHGSLIPWMNFPTIKFLEERLTQDLNLFEFGSGYSTYFYANRVRTVTSVEYDEKWLHIIESQVPDNVKLIFQEKDRDGDYCRTIGATGDHYDVVLVDGRDRVHCVKQSISALSAKGVILLDDSHRDKYQEAINYAKEMGFKILNLEGLKAAEAELYRTSIFYREGNCLEI
jgi:hypothetical protein